MEKSSSSTKICPFIPNKINISKNDTVNINNNNKNNTSNPSFSPVLFSSPLERPSNFVRRDHKSLTTAPSSSTATHNFSTILDSYTVTEQNPTYHENMEDFTLTINHFNNESYRYLFCIFDGHGGDTTAKLCQKKFPQIFRKCLIENPSNYELALTSSFSLMDKELEKIQSTMVGNTATVVFINNRLIYCANVGDSSCVLVEEKSASFFSIDDKCTDPREEKRILSGGGIIQEGRLEGILAISRGMGDFDLKTKGLICTPHINKKLINKNLKFCVIASDGVWDVLSPDDVFRISNENHYSKDIAEKIVNEALGKGSDDNISCIVIELNKKVKKA